MKRWLVGIAATAVLLFVEPPFLKTTGQFGNQVSIVGGGKAYAEPRKEVDLEKSKAAANRVARELTSVVRRLKYVKRKGTSPRVKASEKLKLQALQSDLKNLNVQIKKYDLKSLESLLVTINQKISAILAEQARLQSAGQRSAATSASTRRFDARLIRIAKREEERRQLLPKPLEGADKDVADLPITSKVGAPTEAERKAHFADNKLRLIKYLDMLEKEVKDSKVEVNATDRELRKTQKAWNKTWEKAKAVLFKKLKSWKKELSKAKSDEALGGLASRIYEKGEVIHFAVALKGELGSNQKAVDFLDSAILEFFRTGDTWGTRRGIVDAIDALNKTDPSLKSRSFLKGPMWWFNINYREEESKQFFRIRTEEKASERTKLKKEFLSNVIGLAESAVARLKETRTSAPKIKKVEEMLKYLKDKKTKLEQDPLHYALRLHGAVTGALLLAEGELYAKSMKGPQKAYFEKCLQYANTVFDQEFKRPDLKSTLNPEVAANIMLWAFQAVQPYEATMVENGFYTRLSFMMENERNMLKGEVEGEVNELRKKLVALKAPKKDIENAVFELRQKLYEKAGSLEWVENKALKAISFSSGKMASNWEILSRLSGRDSANFLVDDLMALNIDEKSRKYNFANTAVLDNHLLKGGILNSELRQAPVFDPTSSLSGRDLFRAKEFGYNYPQGFDTSSKAQMQRAVNAYFGIALGKALGKKNLADLSLSEIKALAKSMQSNYRVPRTQANLGFYYLLWDFKKALSVTPAGSKSAQKNINLQWLRQRRGQLTNPDAQAYYDRAITFMSIVDAHLALMGKKDSKGKLLNMDKNLGKGAMPLNQKTLKELMQGVMTSIKDGEEAEAKGGVQETTHLPKLFLSYDPSDFKSYYKGGHIEANLNIELSPREKQYDMKSAPMLAAFRLHTMFYEYATKEADCKEFFVIMPDTYSPKEIQVDARVRTTAHLKEGNVYVYVDKSTDAIMDAREGARLVEMGSDKVWRIRVNKNKYAFYRRTEKVDGEKVTVDILKLDPNGIESKYLDMMSSDLRGDYVRSRGEYTRLKAGEKKLTTSVGTRMRSGRAGDTPLRMFVWSNQMEVVFKQNPTK